MMQEYEKKPIVSGRSYYIVLSLVCLIAFLLILSVNLVQGKSLIWIPDGEALYYNFFVYEGELLRGLLGSAGQPDFAVPLFSFESGYGADLLGTMAGCINDPFNLISVAIPPRYAEYALGALVFVRFFLAACAFSFYALSRGNDRYAALCGSLCYVLCGFSLFWGVLRHPNFLNLAILLPLLFAGADRVFERKSPVLLILSMAAQFAVSVYFSYMAIIVLAVYCLVKYCFAQRRKTIRDFALLVAQFVLFLLIAALLAGIFLVPIVLMLTSMDRVGIERDIPLFDTLSFYWQYTSNLLGASMSDRGLVLGPVAVAGTIALVVSGRALPMRIKCPWLVGLALCLVGSMLPPFGSLMNGFGYSSDRWMVILGFCAAYAVTLVLPVLRCLGSRQWAVYGFLAGLVCVSTVLYAVDIWGGGRYLVVAFLFALVAAALVFLGRRVNGHIVACVFSALTVVGAFVSVGILSGAMGTANSLGDYQKLGDAYAISRTIPLSSVKDDLSQAYRVDRERILGMRNQAFSQGFKGADCFSSFYNQNVDDFRRSLGISDSHFNYIFNGHDARFGVGGVMGARYFVTQDEENAEVPFGYEKIADLGAGHNGKKYVLYENKLALPLAFVYRSAISEESFNRLSMTEREELLTRACVLEGVDEEASEALVPGATQSQEPIITAKKGAVCADGVIKVFEENAKIVLKVDGVASANNSIVLENFVMAPIPLIERQNLRIAHDPDASEPSSWTQRQWVPERSTELTVKGGNRSKKIKLSNSLHNGYGGKVDWVVNMGYSGEPVKRYVLKIQRPGIYTYDSLYVSSQNLEAVSANLKTLREQNTASISFSTNRMDVHVEAEKDRGDGARYVFVSVPYSAGWSAVVDDRSVAIQKANIGFMAIEVDGAPHDIRLTYCTPGLKAGAACTLVGVLGLVALVAVRRQRAKRAERKEQHEQTD